MPIAPITSQGQVLYIKKACTQKCWNEKIEIIEGKKRYGGFNPKARGSDKFKR